MKAAAFSVGSAVSLPSDTDADAVAPATRLTWSIDNVALADSLDRYAGWCLLGSGTLLLEDDVVAGVSLVEDALDATAAAVGTIGAAAGLLNWLDSEVEVGFAVLGASHAVSTTRSMVRVIVNVEIEVT